MSRLVPWWLWVVLASWLVTAAVWYSIPANAAPNPSLTFAEQSFADNGGGLRVCEVFNEYGVTPTTVIGVVTTVARVGGFPLNPDSVWIVNYSVRRYCPQHWAELVAIGDAARAAGGQSI